VSDLFAPDAMEKNWQAACAILRAEGHDVDALSVRAAANLPTTVEEMERRRNTPWTDEERAAVVCFVMEGPL
jgi:hypothetical protein